MKESTVGLAFASHDGRRSSVAGSLVLGLFLPLGLACSGQGADAQAQVANTGVRAEAAQQPDPSAPPPGGSPRLSPQEQAQQPLRLSEMGYNEGSAEAPVKVLELSDFGCGYCRRFHEETYPRLREIYVDTGFVEWKYIPFVLGKFPNGLQAAMAAECAGEQDAFFPMADELFAEQGAWKNAEDPYPYFSGLTADLGIDTERFDSCIEGGWRESRIRASLRLGQQLGARGTPTFVVDGQLVQGALPLDSFREVIDVALRRKGVKPPSR